MVIESGLSTAAWIGCLGSRKMQDLGKIEAAADSGNQEARGLRVGMQSAKDRAVPSLRRMQLWPDPSKRNFRASALPCRPLQVRSPIMFPSCEAGASLSFPA